MFHFKCTVFLVVLAFETLGLSKPFYKEWSKKLNGMLLMVNQEPKLVGVNEILTISRHDCIRIVEGYCYADCKIVNLNLVGYDNKGIPRPGEDRNQDICFHKDIDYNWAVGPEKNRFLIVADSGSKRHGLIEIEVVEPQIRYVEVEVDGKNQTITNGSYLDLKRDSKFIVNRIITNFGHAKGVTYKPVVGQKELNEAGSEKSGPPDAIEFSYKGSVIGQITIRVAK